MVRKKGDPRGPPLLGRWTLLRST